MENILITGITGQDGKYLCKSLLNDKKEIKIYGVTRSLELSKKFYLDLEFIGCKDTHAIELVELNLEDFNSVFELIKKIKPSQIFNLSGPSSVYNSLNKSENTIRIIKSIFDNLINSLIQDSNFCKFFQASSSELFAKNMNYPFSESSTLATNSPYGEAKLYCHNKCLELVNNFDWPIVSGIMFNHESVLREESYLISKIINSAINIANKTSDSFTIGSLDYIRDWLHVEDTIKAVIAICDSPKDSSYVIGSGEGNTIEELINVIFSYFNLDYKKYIRIDSSLLREGDVKTIISDPTNLKKDYSWKNQYTFKSMLEEIIEFKINSKNRYL